MKQQYPTGLLNKYNEMRQRTMRASGFRLRSLGLRASRECGRSEQHQIAARACVVYVVADCSTCVIFHRSASGLTNDTRTIHI